MLDTFKIISLVSELGVKKYKIYNCLTAASENEAVIVDDNDDRHELVVGEFALYYGKDHLLEVAKDQMDTDFDEGNIDIIIEYAYRRR